MARVATYWRATRPWSFTVSVIPPILAVLIAVSEHPGLGVNWLHFLLTLIGCVLIHAGSNSLSDYFDFKSGVDREGTFGSSGSQVLVGQLMRPGQLLFFASCLFALAGLIGLYFILVIPQSLFLAWIILAGFILAAFYTMAPLKLKYIALGDIAVFFAFGPLMALGAYYVHTSQFSWTPVLYTIPIGLLVIAILHSNNLRDIATDSVVHIKTVPILVGERSAQIIYYALVVGAYVTTFILIGFARLTWLATATLLSLPLAMKNMRMVRDKNSIAIENFAPIDGMTAQLHSAFGLLFLLAILVQILFL